MYEKSHKGESACPRLPYQEQLELVETEVMDGDNVYYVQEFKKHDDSNDERKFLKHTDFSLSNVVRNGLDKALKEVPALEFGTLGTYDHLDSGLSFFDKINKSTKKSK